MTNRPKYVHKGVRPLADIIGEALTPACRKRGFAGIDLIQYWPDIVGPAYAEVTSPEKLSWPRRPPGMITEEAHEPALLTMRCSGGAALRVTHELPQLIERINIFFGYRCVGRIKLIQLPVARLPKRVKRIMPPISPEADARVRELAAGITEPDLRQKLERLGRAIMADKARPITKS